jgi:N-acetyl-gamma-glutamyl-phosphate reductase
MTTFTAGIIGATGYAGTELTRLLSAHPRIGRLVLASTSHEHERIEDIYLNFQGTISVPLEKPEEVIAAADIVFASLPSGVGEQYAAACLKKGVSCIDLSADFRFGADEAAFTAWYGKPYAHPELRERSVYGLPELNREKIKAQAATGPLIIGNPGCYPTAASLGVYPALAMASSLGRGLADPQATIIVDAASGVSGGGREPSRAFHYPECADSIAPYKVGAHRHTPEIARNFAEMAGRPVNLIFTPHLAPMNRGILATIYIPLAEKWRFPQAKDRAVLPPSNEITIQAGEIRNLYADFYQNEPLVRVLPAGTVAATGRVRQSAFCDLSVHLDQAGSTLIVESAIDNMVKGAAGQAIQNMNIIFGFGETEGLRMIPALF